MTNRSTWLVCASTIALFASTPVFAQQEAPTGGGQNPLQSADPAAQQLSPASPAPSVQGAAQTEIAPDIIVTGTSIRGAAPVGSSLVSIGRGDIETSAATTTTALLQETPQVLNYGVNESTRNGNGGAGNIVYGSAINLRGVGPYATLTLIDGRRAIPQGTLAATVDPSMIPTIALERIEIVADGSSAIYGSDAVAGVANLILRRKVEGVQVDMQKSFADNYGEYQLGAIAGHTWGSGQITVAYGHSYHSNLAGADRDFYQSDLTSRGGSDYRVPQCVPGNIVNAGQSYAIPASGATPTNLVAGTQNLCDNVKATDILPQSEINSGILTFDQDITGGVHFFLDGLIARRDTLRLSTVANQNLVVPNTNAFYVAPTGSTATSETVQYNFADDYGPNATSNISSQSWQLSGGFDIDLPHDFRLTVYGTAGHDKESADSAGNNVNSSTLTTALASSDPAIAFNPFGTSTNGPAVIAAIFDQYTHTFSSTDLRSTGAKIDGSLFTLPGGDVRAAIGVDYYDLKLETGQLRGPASNMTGTDQHLSRNVQSLYGELLVPIFGSDNAIPGFARLELDLAGRIDKYNDVGTTKNPKIGINWSPISDIKIHGSYGTSFRAPLLTQLVSAGGSQLYIQNYFDPTAKGGAGATVQGVALSGGNLDLKPETARTYSLGVDYIPSFLSGARFSLNYFDLVYKGQIASFLSNLNLLRQESLYSSVILRGSAAQARINELIADGLRVNGGTPAAAQAANVFVDGRTNNLGTTITRGLDFELTAPIHTDNAGTFRLGVRGTRFFVYKVAITPAAPVTDQLNNLDYPLKLRMRGSLGWSLGPVSATAFVNYQNGYDNPNSTLAPRIKANTTVDLNLSYAFGNDYEDGRKGLKLGLEVVNLFDKDPPFADIAPTNNGGGGFDPQTSNPIGRVVAVSLSKKF